MTSRPQQLAALQQANAIRIATARTRHQIHDRDTADGCLLVVNILEHPVAPEGRLRIGWLLLSIRRIGRVRSGRWLKAADIRSFDRKVNELSDRQRRLLAQLLRTHANSRTGP